MDSFLVIRLACISPGPCAVVVAITAPDPTIAAEIVMAVLALAAAA
jgi:hypothetical protein